MATKYSKPIYNPKLKLLRPYLFKNNESNSIYSLNKSWDQIHEDEMLEFYKSDQRFANMRTYFRQIHPQTADNYSIASLKSQFFRILRAVLKQISIFLQLKGQKNFPEMIKLDG